MVNFLYKPKNQLLVLIAACCLFVLIIKPWQLYFLNDDFLHVPLNKDWLFLRGGFMRPVPNFFLLWDKALYGSNALGYFATSLLLHTACVIIVFFLTKLVEKYFFAERKESVLAFITAILFLCYPYHAEPIMWVIGRVAIIAAIFTFLSLFFYIKHNDSKGFLIVSWICLVIALFTYESMWNVILLFAFISFYNIKKGKNTLAKEAFPFAIMATTFITYIIYRHYILGTVAGEGYAIINENLFNIKLLLINLIKLTGRNFTPPIPNSLYSVIIFGASVIFYSYCIYRAFKKNSYWGWFLIALCIATITGVITAAPLGIDTHYNESERYIYYSSFYFCLLVGLLIVLLVSSKYQLQLAGLISILFIALLIDLQDNYRKASAITRTTVGMFAKYPNYERAVMIDLPEKYRGTMILRMDPKPAQNWIVPQAAYDTILVQNQTDNVPVLLPLKTGEKDWSEMAKEKKWNANVAQVPDSLNRMEQLTEKDVLFWYKPEGIYKINIPSTLFQKKE